MKLTFSTYNNTVYKSLRPWKDVVLNEDRFKNLLNSNVRANKDNPVQFFNALSKAYSDLRITTEQENIQEFKEFSNISINPEFLNELRIVPLPLFSNKTSEFFSYLVKNTTTCSLCALAETIKLSLNSDVAKLHIYRTTTTIENLLNSIILAEKDTQPTKYVFTIFKISLLNLYNEIKILYPGLLPDNIQSEYEITVKAFTNYEVEKSIPNTPSNLLFQYYSTRKPIEIIENSAHSEQAKSDKQLIDKPLFNPKPNDFRDGYKGKLSFEDIVNKEAFINVENRLYEYDFIDNNYNFTNQHNKKKELAAIYSILIQKNYFKKNNFKHRANFDPAHYRQYLDHRYNIETSQQFRKNTPAYIKSVSDKYYWLDILPTCR